MYNSILSLLHYNFSAESLYISYNHIHIPPTTLQIPVMVNNTNEDVLIGCIKAAAAALLVAPVVLFVVLVPALPVLVSVTVVPEAVLEGEVVEEDDPAEDDEVLEEEFALISTISESVLPKFVWPRLILLFVKSYTT